VLVLTRKAGESIMIGDDVEVVVLSVEGQKVRLGFHAPPSLAVHREEVYRAINSGGEHDRPDHPDVPRAKRRAR
jgi:carbon storage regulator